MLEHLEGRRLMSVTLDTSVTGVLGVNGSPERETVLIEEYLTGMVRITDTTYGDMDSPGEVVYDGASSGLILNVRLGDGDDGIDLVSTSLAAKIYSGAGDDAVSIDNFGAWIYVDAGDGFDSVYVNDGESNVGTMAFGGSNDDYMKVEAGSKNADLPTVLLGGNGSDYLEDSGSAVEDPFDPSIVTVTMGIGHSVLNGDNGSDVFVSFNYDTLINGGRSGEDAATLYYAPKAGSVGSVEIITIIPA